eukprot:174939-Prymnesium_polylepis.1
MTLGRATPIDGDMLHVGFIAHYNEGCQKNACGAEPTEGLQNCSQINDAQATVYFELAKVYRKLMAVEQQLATLLAGNLTLYSDANIRLDDIRYTFHHVCAHETKARALLDLVARHLTKLLRDSADSLKGSSLHLEQPAP